MYVPLSFEAQTGAFGPRTRTFLREVVKVADAASSADLYHWSAMVWGLGGTLGAALGREARAGGGKSRARRGRDGAGERRGELGAKGVARVVSDRLPAKRQRASQPHHHTDKENLD
jgi:hypothetical protein